MLQVLRRLISFIALGAVLGDLVAMWIAPSAITWFISLPAQSSLCNCVESATRTAEALIKVQLLGAGLGALTGGVVGELATRTFLAWKQKRAAAHAKELADKAEQAKVEAAKAAADAAAADAPKSE
jgi:hypothetical protein